MNTTEEHEAVQKKTRPIPVRFEEEEDEALDQLSRETGLNKSELIRRAVRFAGPKFLSGEVDILRVGREGNPVGR